MEKIIKIVFDDYMKQTTDKSKSSILLKKMDKLEQMLYKILPYENKTLLLKLVYLIDKFIVAQGEEVVKFSMDWIMLYIKNNMKKSVNDTE